METYEIYDYEMPELLNQFLGYLYTVRNKSERTILGYKSDLRMFLRFMVKTKDKLKTEDLDEISISHIDEEFLKSIKLAEIFSFINFVSIKRKNGSNARARKIAAIKGFFAYLETKAKVIKENPARELESPKIEKRQPIYLNLEQSRKLLDTAKTRKENRERNLCIITLFLNCGMRLSELVGINISSIKGDTLRVIGKGNKERTIYLNKACLRAIDEYLAVRPTPEKEDSDALFLSERKRRLDKRSVESMIKTYIENADLTDKNYTPHKLRHTAATLMYKHGEVDIRSLQKILGHESVSTTQIYTHVDEEQLRQASKKNPLSEEQV